MSTFWINSFKIWTIWIMIRNSLCFKAGSSRRGVLRSSYDKPNDRDRWGALGIPVLRSALRAALRRCVIAQSRFLERKTILQNILNYEWSLSLRNPLTRSRSDMQRHKPRERRLLFPFSIHNKTVSGGKPKRKVIEETEWRKSRFISVTLRLFFLRVR